MKLAIRIAVCVLCACPVPLALAQSAAKPAAGGAPPVKLSEHVRNDITRHRAMAAAHEAAARCLESGRSEIDCVADLQASCHGLGIGRYCGLKHEH
jgi:hypothetical protein